MPISEIASGIAALSHLKNLLAGAKGLSDGAKVNSIIVEAQQYMLVVQQSLFEAQEAVSDIARKNRT